MIGEGWNEFILRHPRVVERAMGIKCETVNCAWEKSVPGRSWRSTMLRGEKGGTPHIPSSLPLPREGWSLRIRKEGRPVGEKREGFVVDLNARSSDRATFEGEGVAHSLEGAGNLLRYVERSLPSEYEERFLLWFEEREGWMAVPLWQWKVGEGWSAVSQWKRKLEEGGDGEHGARNIKRGMKETAVTYATRKSSSEKLHPSMPLELGPPLHFNDGTGISRQRYVSMSRESEEIPLSFFFLYSLNPIHFWNDIIRNIYIVILVQ